MEYLLNEPWLLGLVLAISLAVAIELGQRTGGYIHEDTNRKDQMVAIRDGLFVLVSLLLSFTLALAVPRYTERRTQVVKEAVSIETTFSAPAFSPSPIAITLMSSCATTSMPGSISTTPAWTRPA